MADKYLVSMAWLSRQAIRDVLERYWDEELQLPLGPRSQGQGSDETIQGATAIT